MKSVIRGFFRRCWTFSKIAFGIAAVLMLFLGLRALQAAYITRNSVLLIDLSRKILDGSESNFGGWFSSDSRLEPITLYEFLSMVERAKKDDRIVALVIRIESPNCGWATLQEIRKSLEDFKKTSSKPLYSYGMFLSEKGYFVASIADKIYIQPNGSIEWKGQSLEVTHYSKLLQSLGIEPIIYKIGKFKSAVEPLSLPTISAENYMQNKILLDTIHNNIIKSISISRNISVIKLNNYADSLQIRTDYDALSKKMVTKIASLDDIISDLNSLFKKSVIIDYEKYSHRDFSIFKTPVRNKIAIVIVSGEIVMGQGGQGLIGSEALINQLDKLSNNASVKAIVLRINSKGGSAIASDILCHKLREIDKIKPVIASFGDYAASGGYYIAMGCRKIVASETTLTGSIGIFGYYFNTQKLYNKLGISTVTLRTNNYADFPSKSRPPSKFERQTLQADALYGYNKFINEVVLNRKLPTKRVQEVSGGRVWSGAEAYKIHLIDKVGGLTQAIELASKEAKLQKSDYEVTLEKQVVDWTNLYSHLLPPLWSQMRIEQDPAYAALKLYYQANTLVGLQARLDEDYEIK